MFSILDDTFIDAAIGQPSTGDRLFADADKPVRFFAAMDRARRQGPDAVDCDAMRFAAEVQKASERSAFQPEFTARQWATFSSYCVARRLPTGFRVLIPGQSERTLRFVVEGCLWQQAATAAGLSKAVLPGAILGEDALFSDRPNERDVRTLEDTLVLELSLSRQRELMAACPAIAFELMRAAGAAIAARGRTAAPATN